MFQTEKLNYSKRFYKLSFRYECNTIIGICKLLL